MAQANMILTVNGPLDPSQLGTTLMHEHVFCDLRGRLKEPEEVTKKAFYLAPFTPQDRWRLSSNALCNRDNLVLDDLSAAVTELVEFKKVGGKSLVDQTTIGLGRDPSAVRAAANLTGLNIVIGTGYYAHYSHPAEMPALSEQQLGEQMERDVREGVDGTNVRCGIIGEIGCEIPSEPELKVARGAARAQRATGAPVSIHTMFLYTGRDGGLKIAAELEKAGADLARVIFCHQDGSGSDFQYQKELLRRGINLEYDLFGFDLTFVALGKLRQWPTDTQRIQELKRLIDEGYIGQLLISHDICTKCQLRAYGGWGYAHILTTLPHSFAAAGLSQRDVQIILVENPKRLLTLHST